jgi:phosphoglycerate dehydrogenase-like enzyme
MLYLEYRNFQKSRCLTLRKLVVTHHLEQEYVNELKAFLPDWDIVVGKETYKDHIQDAEIILGWKKEVKDILENSTSLKWVQTWSAGVNNLPLQTLNERGVMVTSANGVHAYPISETIFGLMLALTRNIHSYVRNQATKTWHHAGLRLEIHGKTIGIIGVGAIGKETAKIAKAFGMKVLGVRNSLLPEEHVDEMYSTSELDSVLPQCDYVVSTLPLTSSTKGLFSSKQFQVMKRDAFFINIGRGEIVVEKDLIHALQTGEIAGAGLDVFEVEPLPESSPLWEMENVIITPHTSGSTEYYDRRVVEDIFLPNLRQYVNGEKPSINVVDFVKGY